MNEMNTETDSKNLEDLSLLHGKVSRDLVTLPDILLSRSSTEPPSKKKRTRKHLLKHAVEAQQGDEVDEEEDVVEEEKPKKKRTWRKPKGKPKRPLSAYNLFFQHERGKLITSGENESEERVSSLKEGSSNLKRRHRKTHGKIGFADLARTISSKWKAIDPASKKVYEEEAEREKQRYKIALAKWRDDQNLKQPSHSNEDDTSVPIGYREAPPPPAIAPNRVMPARRVSSDQSTSSASTVTAAAAAAAAAAMPQPQAMAALTCAERDSLVALLAARRRLPPRRMEAEFFPRLMPDALTEASLYDRSMAASLFHPIYGSSLAAAAAAAPSSCDEASRYPVSAAAVAAAAANGFGQRRLEIPPQANPLHDLALYSDMYGRSFLLGTALPDETTASNLMYHLYGPRFNGM